ncbi:type II toxin-antitoxin system ParD family antitoxin [Phenylobacterium sp.]|uniref:type II toxin-antitoxin system ParD family antitoxin n=1 Tax=Phenylobacterium sp. TaxID=1871053 RepID=UPI002732B22E|nr:type II toxin-antitoxin system ParD family antitoxin [Phenylobacterium sp.]MDP3852555.1 type II toxin-antitoxin system ParD family antitoxin [Phenylobacterium sp.]
MPTRNVVLTERQDAMIAILVRSGSYKNASEVLRDGLRLLEQRQAEEVARIEVLRDAAQVGMASIEAGKARRFETLEGLEIYLDGLGKGRTVGGPG